MHTKSKRYQRDRVSWTFFIIFFFLIIFNCAVQRKKKKLSFTLCSHHKLYDPHHTLAALHRIVQQFSLSWAFNRAARVRMETNKFIFTTALLWTARARPKRYERDFSSYVCFPLHAINNLYGLNSVFGVCVGAPRAPIIIFLVNF